MRLWPFGKRTTTVHMIPGDSVQATLSVIQLAQRIQIKNLDTGESAVIHAPQAGFMVLDLPQFREMEYELALARYYLSLRWWTRIHRRAVKDGFQVRGRAYSVKGAA